MRTTVSHDLVFELDVSGADRPDDANTADFVLHVDREPRTVDDELLDVLNDDS